MGKIKKFGALSGLAAAAAGAYYFYYSKGAKKNRKAAQDWMESAKDEVISEARRLKDAALNEKNYNRVVEAVTEKYRKLRNLEAKEVERFGAALGSAWSEFKKELGKGKKK